MIQVIFSPANIKIENADGIYLLHFIIAFSE